MTIADETRGVLERANALNDYLKEEHGTYMNTREDDDVLRSAITYEVIFPNENKLKLKSLAFPITNPTYAYVFYDGCGRPAKVCVEQIMNRVDYNDYEGLLEIIENSMSAPVRNPPKKKEDKHRTFY